MTQQFLDLYNGYCNTNLLWNNIKVFDFKQLTINNFTKALNIERSASNQRLGKLVEQFVFSELRQQDNIQLLEENIQIKNGKQTIGELDTLLLHNGSPIHLEIVYKFYLYDTRYTYNEPLAYWIGPNRNDSLIYKLEKLKTKQLPLLYSPLTQPILDKHNIKASAIEQQLCFKAQLFLPYKRPNINVTPLNKDCISGYYISFKHLELLKGYEFHLPTKLEWLVSPNLDVDWLSYTDAETQIETFTSKKRSPLCWLKKSNGQLEKCFITFW